MTIKPKMINNQTHEAYIVYPSEKQAIETKRILAKNGISAVYQEETSPIKGDNRKNYRIWVPSTQVAKIKKLQLF